MIKTLKCLSQSSPSSTNQTKDLNKLRLNPSWGRLSLGRSNSLVVPLPIEHQPARAAVVAQQLEHTPHNQEVVGLNPTECWAFLLHLSFPTFLYQWRVPNQVPQGGAPLTVCCGRKKWMPSCAA